jgi:hypothetical protein
LGEIKGMRKALFSSAATKMALKVNRVVLKKRGLLYQQSPFFGLWILEKRRVSLPSFFN